MLMGKRFFLLKVTGKSTSKPRFLEVPLNLFGKPNYWMLQESTTDSRFRPDRRSLLTGDADLATKHKKTLEKQQRTEEKTRTVPWTPVWFSETKDHLGAQFFESNQKRGTKDEQLPSRVQNSVCNFCQRTEEESPRSDQ